MNPLRLLKTSGMAGILRTGKQVARLMLLLMAAPFLSPVLLAQQDSTQQVPAAISDSNVRHPNVFIVSVGISQYKGDKLKLSYASKDAIAFSNALHAASKKMFDKDGSEHVFSYTYSTEQGTSWPSRDNIKKPFEEISGQALEDDILVVFFAGHGVTKNGQFYLLTQEASAFELTGVENYVAISAAELGSWMRGIKARKQLLILDACNSGQAVQQMQDMLTKREVTSEQPKTNDSLEGLKGTYILAASASSQAAYETSLYGQGLLTHSLLAGLKNGEALAVNGSIDVISWFNAAAARVSNLAKKIGGRQEPQVIGRDPFYLGIVDSSIAGNIIVPDQKKIFKGATLRQQEVPVDDLELTGLVNKELNLAASEKESLFIFMENNTFTESYSLAGNYEVRNDTVTARIFVIKGLKEAVGQFTLVEAVSRKEELARAIVLRVKEFIGRING